MTDVQQYLDNIVEDLPLIEESAGTGRLLSNQVSKSHTGHIPLNYYDMKGSDYYLGVMFEPGKGEFRNCARFSYKAFPDAICQVSEDSDSLQMLQFKLTPVGKVVANSTTDIVFEVSLCA